MVWECPICAAGEEAINHVNEQAESGVDLINIRYSEIGKKYSLTAYDVKYHISMHSKIDPSKLHRSVKINSASRLTLDPKKATHNLDEIKAATEETNPSNLYGELMKSTNIEDVLREHDILEEDYQSMDAVLSVVQKIALKMHLYASAAALKSIDLHMADTDAVKYPFMAVKGYSLTSAAIAQAFGIVQATNLTTAATTLTAAGYTISDSTPEPEQLAPQAVSCDNEEQAA